MMNRVIPDPIDVYFSHSGISSVKIPAGAAASEHPDFSWQIGVDSCFPGVRRIFMIRDIHVSHLGEGMNAGVRPSCSMNSYRLREHLEESILQMVLYTVSIGLRLPPVERAPVVRDRQFQPFKAFHGWIQGIERAREIRISVHPVFRLVSTAENPDSFAARFVRRPDRSFSCSA